MNHLWLGSLLLTMLVQQPQQQSPGINFFSLEQDIEIGSESSREADSLLPLVRESHLEDYFRSVGIRLARNSPLPSLRYQFRIVNSTDVNAVTFPGGIIYVDRGLIELASNEHELAAILAHEIAHATARHGTEQLTRQLLVQGPSAIAAIVAGSPGDNEWKNQLRRLGISFGTRALFLRYSPDQELEANRIAVDILQKSGYSPSALAIVLEKVHQTNGTEKTQLPIYAYNHPQSGEASAQLEQEIESVGEIDRPRRTGAGFRTFSSGLLKVALPVADEPVETASPETVLANQYIHPQEYYRLRYPEGWDVQAAAIDGAMIAPPAGVQSSRAGDDLKIGVMFDLFDLSGREMTLEEATNRLLIFLRQRNQPTRPGSIHEGLRLIPGAQAQMLMGSEPALRTVMIGRLAPSEPSEIVWVVTRRYYETLFYLVCVAPEEEFSSIYQPIFEEIIQSVELR